MGMASGYSLDLYCDNAGDGKPGGYGYGSPADGHAFRAFPAEFYGETWSECARNARAAGWKIDRRERTAICPKCARKAREASRTPKSPSQGGETTNHE